VYGSHEVRTLTFIRRSRELGFSLDDIRTLLRLGGPEKASCREVREIAAHHLEDIRAKLDDLKKLERLLAKTVAKCSGKMTPDCPVLDPRHPARFDRSINPLSVSAPLSRFAPRGQVK
jgi:MerR family mercuric resistance operon transcriptional regulator